jgi:hypothetical protein
VADAICDLPQGKVARRVSEGVVDSLEVVNVEHQQSNWVLRTTGPFYFAVQ